MLRDLLPGGAPIRLSAEKAAALMKGIRPATATDCCRRDLAWDLLADLRRVDRQVRDNEGQMRDALAAARTALTALPGVGTVLAAKLLGHVGDARAFPPSTTSPATPVRHRWTRPAARTPATASTPEATAR
ncbi:hypothetical protein OG985_47545 [Streptomyces sp. NBC_00289]|uniref:hypothetical protein n=1 Tax=Streptomyces sp. NBC_00289 TaxID=2975703 RepID=UPI003253DF1E